MLRSILAVLCGVAPLLISKVARAEDLAVIEVRRSIPLSDSEPVYTDYYISSGSELGLKPNLVLNVFRKVNLKDATGVNAYGEFNSPVGQLRVLFVTNKIAIAREFKIASRDDVPMLEQNGILIGDKVELKGSFIDNRKLTAKKVANLETPKPVEVAVNKPVEKESKPKVENTEKAEAVSESEMPETEKVADLASGTEKVAEKTTEQMADKTADKKLGKEASKLE